MTRAERLELDCLAAAVRAGLLLGLAAFARYATLDRQAQQEALLARIAERLARRDSDER